MKLSIRIIAAIAVVVSPNLIFEAFQTYPRWEDVIKIALFQILAIAWFEAIMLVCDAQDYLNSDDNEGYLGMTDDEPLKLSQQLKSEGE